MPKKPASRHSQTLLTYLQHVRSYFAAGRYDEIDRTLGKRPGHLTRIIRRSRKADESRSGHLPIQDLFGYLNELHVEPSDFFAGAFGSPSNLCTHFLSEIREERPVEIRRLKIKLGSSRDRETVVLRDISEIELKRFTDTKVAESETCLQVAHIQRKGALDQESAGLLGEYWGILASIYRAQGLFSVAAYCLLKSFELLDQWNLHQLRGKLLLRASYLLRDRNECHAAAATAKEAIVYFAIKCDLTGIGKALVDLAVMLRSTGDLDAAIASYNSGLKLLPEEEDLYKFAVYQGLGICLVETGRVSEAKQYLSKALAFLRLNGPEKSHLMAWALWLRAEIYFEESDFQSAKQDYQDIYEIYLKNGIAFDVATAAIRLTKVLLALSDLGGVRKLAFELDSIVKVLHKDHANLALALGELQRAALRAAATDALIDQTFMLFKDRGTSSAEAPRT